MRCGDFRTSYAADMAIFDSNVGRGATIAIVAALLTVPVFASAYWLDILTRAAIAVVAALGLNILTGFTGQISLGNAAFLAVGAYATAALAKAGLPFPLVIPLAGLVTAGRAGPPSRADRKSTRLN